MNREFSKVGFVIGILALAMVACFPQNVSAQTTALKVECPDLVNPTVSEYFNISIIIENVPEPGFYGWEFILSWNSSLLNCTEEVINYDLWGGNYLGPWVTDPIDNEAGQYHQSLSGKQPGEPEVGTFWLVNLTFVILQVPEDGTFENDFTLSPPEGAEYCIADIEANEIPHEYIDGHVTIVPEFSNYLLLVLLTLLAASTLLVKKSKK